MELATIKNKDSTNGDNVGTYRPISPDINESENCNTILKPGSKIRPEFSVEQIEKLVERLYGITVGDIKELVSYDDRNFLIHEDKNIKNPLITNAWPHGYVLKVLNSLDSQNLEFVDAQTQILLFLRQKKITCPNPIMNVYGKYYSTEFENGVNHVIRLLEFQPGKILHEVPSTKHLFYQCGEFVGQIDKLLKDFCHDGITNRSTLWMLQSMPRLKEFLYVIKDHDRKAMIEKVIETFETKVLSKLDSFEKGVIHGDFNEQNILVTGKDNKFVVSGILDFGDLSSSPLVFELAIAMCYIMLQSRDLATGGLVLAGYSSVRIIPDSEKSILKYCIAARLCQSLVLGAYTHSLDPDNDYLLTTQKAGWELLESLWKELLDRVDEIWQSTADSYLMQSFK